jgi:hypothetical protein
MQIVARGGDAEIEIARPPPSIEIASPDEEFSLGNNRLRRLRQSFFAA